MLLEGKVAVIYGAGGGSTHGQARLGRDPGVWR